MAHTWTLEKPAQVGIFSKPTAVSINKRRFLNIDIIF
jgi:hypothetical protein